LLQISSVIHYVNGRALFDQSVIIELKEKLLYWVYKTIP